MNIYQKRLEKNETELLSFSKCGKGICEKDTDIYRQKRKQNCFCTTALQNNAPLSKMSTYMFGSQTCKYVKWQREIKVANGIKIDNQLALKY